MSYFYVDSTVGTRVSGGGLTKQTGAFSALGAANVYASVADVLADGFTHGDVCCISTNHAEIGVGDLDYAGEYSNGNPYLFYSVDANNCDTYQKAVMAQLTTSSGNILVGGHAAWLGVYFEPSGQVLHSLTELYHNLYFFGSTFKSASSNIPFASQFPGANQFPQNMFVRFEACAFDGGISPFRLYYGGEYEVVRCTFPNAGTEFVRGLTGNGEQSLLMRVLGCDLSAFTANLIRITDAGQQKMFVRRCKLPASFSNGALYDQYGNLCSQTQLEISESGNTDAEMEYGYRKYMVDGSIEIDATIYRAESIAFSSGQKVSYKVVTKANAYSVKGVRVELPPRKIDLSATGTIRIYLASTATLLDTEVFATLLYEDGTIATQSNFIGLLKMPGLDTGAELSTDSGSDWRDGGGALSGYNEYYIDLDTLGDPGANSVSRVELFVGKPSVTVYVDPVVEGI